MSLTLLIPLTNSDKFLMVDMEDQQLAEYRWRLDASGYATINMQAGRMVARTPRDLEVDHINRNKLDNRRSNLRNVTRAQNMQNVGPTIRNTSGYVGVDYQGGKWRARYRENGKTFWLGRFETAEAAGAAVARHKEERGNHALQDTEHEDRRNSHT